MQKILQELGLLFRALFSARIGKITKQKLVLELITNGVALLVTLLISGWVKSVVETFFRKKTVGDKIAEKVKFLQRYQNKDKIAVDQETLSFTEEWLSAIVVFIIGLFIFTYIEKVMEIYLDRRKRR